MSSWSVTARQTLAMTDSHTGDPLAALRFLVGEWTGAGRGVYPTVDDFAYVEQSRFATAPKPFLVYSQATRDPETGEPLHAETGYWRPAGPGRVEAMIVHGNGWVEVTAGTVAGTVIETMSTAVVGTPTAEDDVTALRRRIEVDGEVLRYTLDMAACGHPLVRHLEAELRRT
jgi:THAP4-like, heme-binding beta-barrel domain